MAGETKQFKNNKEWSDKFLPLIARELGETFIQPAPLVDDLERNTDLMVFDNKNHKYAARVRNSEYIKYKHQFTIRCINGLAKTELKKIREGFGDYMFYGIANEACDGFLCFSIIDLDVFRREFDQKTLNPNQENPGQCIENKEEDTAFLVFNFTDFSPNLIVKQVFHSLTPNP